MEEALSIGGALMTAEGEGALIEAAIAGDGEAFARLYDRYLERVYRHVCYRVGHREDAEDITQQVFLQAWRALGRYRRTEASFVAWLLTIAHNLVVSFYRRTKESNYLEWEPEATAHWHNPEAATLARLDWQEVRRNILRLRPEQQQVIIMRFIEDLDYADIAAALGKSEGNIRVILHRALAELRRQLNYGAKE